MKDRPPQARLSTLLTGGIALVASAATAAIWIEIPSVTLIEREPVALGGAMVALIVWLLTIVSEIHRRRARYLAKRLEVVRQRESVVEAPAEIAGPIRVGLMHPPALIASILVLVGAVALRFTPSMQPALASIDARLVPASATVLMWLILLVAMRNHSLARRHMIALHAADGGARLLEEVIDSFPVMVSVCMPDGNRSHFNARYIERTGREEAELADLGWLESVHEEDRCLFEQLADAEGARKVGVPEIEYGMTTRHGANRWVRERFVPRYLSSGELVGYLAVGIDITTQVEAETRRAQELEQMNDELGRNRAALDEAKSEVKLLKGEITKLKRSRDRYQTTVEAAEEDLREAREGLAQAERKAALVDEKRQATQADLKQARFDARKRKLSVERLESKNEALKTSEAVMARRIDEAEKQLTSAVSSAEEDRQAATQLRTKINRLTTRNQELSEELEQLREDHEGAIQNASRAEAAVEERVRDQTRSLAEEMRPSLGGAHDLLDIARTRTLDDAQLDGLDGAQAALGSIIALVDGVLGNEPVAELIDESGGKGGRAFDLRAALESTVKLLGPTARDRGVDLEVVLDKEFPTQVCGDSVHIREALLLLSDRALRLAQEGTLRLELASEGSAPTLVAAKISVACDSGAFDEEALRRLFGVDGDSNQTSEAGGARRASTAHAWELIRGLKGEFGLEAVDSGGFVVWFMLNLPRWSPTAQQRGALVDAPAPAAAAAPPSEPAPQPTQEREPEPGRPLAPSPMASRAAENYLVAPLPPPAGIGVAPTSRRLPQELLKSNLGDVKELGPRGARVKCPKFQKGSVTLILTGGDDVRVELKALVVSCDKKGSKNFDTILEFTDQDARRQNQVLQIAMSHRPITMRPLSGED